ncbi:MAG: hypothetical protein JNL13_08410, partial [Chitinophagaceae bacterium]|nr:hypothetical protein [Chitinophagaceae bacterium]
REFLGRNLGKNFLKLANQAVERPDTMNRVDNYYTETNTGFSGIPFQRPFLSDVVSYIGGQWMILTRACCSFLCTSAETEKFEQYYKNTLIPDESFFQTVLMNTSFDGEIVNDDKRAIIWIPDGDIKLRPKTFTHMDAAFLLNSTHLFARKFDDNTDNTVLNIIERRLGLPSKLSRNIKTISPVAPPKEGVAKTQLSND